MTTIMTIFTATLVQDSALSISGLDRESTSDQPFTIVDGQPVMTGRGIKGAAVAMARRFFDPLPRSISEARDETRALCRSAWEVSNAVPTAKQLKTQLRPGVGILQKTGARANGVLYDREVVPAGTRWDLEFRVDWRLAATANESPAEVEGILGYVLSAHWREKRCWLGGGAARGLGWCHLEDLRVVRLERAAYDAWVIGKRQTLPSSSLAVPMAAPTRSWCFRSLDLSIEVGEYKPALEDSPWGLDMLAIGPHAQEGTSQRFDQRRWTRPPWAGTGDLAAPAKGDPVFLDTDRAIAMEGAVPLLPGSSLRGPMRHAFSRAGRRAGEEIADPHKAPAGVGDQDEGGRLFGTVNKSSRVLIRDGHAEGAWLAARMHMHAEDELSAGSYGSAKRDAVRILRGTFPMQIVIEGPDEKTVTELMQRVDPLVALGRLGHLPIGGHKTRGAGWCRWNAPRIWSEVDVIPAPKAEPRPPIEPKPRRPSRLPNAATSIWSDAWLELACSDLKGIEELSLGEAARLGRAALGEESVLWWCEPQIDLTVDSAPATFGKGWPDESALRVDEIVFFAPRASWRAARTASGWRAVMLREVPGSPTAKPVKARMIPACLHQDIHRFSAPIFGENQLTLREWSAEGQVIGYAAEGRA